MLKFQISLKSFPVGAEFFHADGRTDMTKLVVAFRSFENVLTKGILSIQVLLKFFLMVLILETLTMIGLGLQFFCYALNCSAAGE
jgi:hypothetical protein